MTTYELIRKAIENKQCITCDYGGYSRRMTPHVIGIKNGKEQALFFQYGGESGSGLSDNPEKNWRCIEISKVSNATINRDEFQTAQNHNRGQNCVSIIDLEIQY